MKDEIGWNCWTLRVGTVFADIAQVCWALCDVEIAWDCRHVYFVEMAESARTLYGD